MTKYQINQYLISRNLTFRRIEANVCSTFFGNIQFPLIHILVSKSDYDQYKVPNHQNNINSCDYYVYFRPQNRGMPIIRNFLPQYSLWVEYNTNIKVQWNLDLRKILGVTKIFLKPRFFLISNTRKSLITYIIIDDTKKIS